MEEIHSLTTDIIIIGAGAAGLMAAKTLTEQGLTVCVLEARDRIGGRIHTFNDPLFSEPAEAGAEFVHGNLEVTLNLLKEAGLDTIEQQGEMWHVFDGKWNKEEGFIEHEELVINKLKELQDDISIAEFLQREFGEEQYADLRQSLLSYVEGYYAGEPDRTSALAFLQEWQSEDDQQYRPKNGYTPMIRYLAGKATAGGCTIKLSTAVEQINWQQGRVEIIDEKYNSYVASKVLITVPLGIWTADKGDKGAINFLPDIPQKKEAAHRMGFGAAIKILMKFDEPFWQEDDLGNIISNMNFIVSDAEIGTWWTQNPVQSSLLTGWKAGPKAAALKNASAEIIYEQAIDSLAYLFNMEKETITKKLVAWKVFNWCADPFSRGAYAYSTMETNEARKVMMQPLEDTLFFAGEALYDGPEMGTVEAALTSGQKVASIILTRKD